MDNTLKSVGNSVNIAYVHEESQQYKRDAVSLTAKGNIVLPIILFTGIAIGLMISSLYREN